MENCCFFFPKHLAKNVNNCFSKAVICNEIFKNVYMKTDSVAVICRYLKILLTGSNSEIQYVYLRVGYDSYADILVTLRSILSMPPR